MTDSTNVAYPHVARAIHPSPEARASAARLALWLTLIALCMAFLALIGSYIVLRAAALRWPPEGVRLNLPLGAVNTLILLASSGALALALRREREGRTEDCAFPPSIPPRGDARLFLQVGGGLAVAFLGLQALQYYWLINNFGQKLYSSPFGTTFYALTGLHALHLVVGIGWLLWLWLSGLRPGKILALELCGLYWHFVTGVWVVLFVILYLA